MERIADKYIVICSAYCERQVEVESINVIIFELTFHQLLSADLCKLNMEIWLTAADQKSTQTL